MRGRQQWRPIGKRGRQRRKPSGRDVDGAGRRVGLVGLADADRHRVVADPRARRRACAGVAAMGAEGRTVSRPRFRNAALIVVVSVAVGMFTMPVGSDALAGSAGTDTSLPATPSQVTVAGRGSFANLEVTVNQT